MEEYSQEYFERRWATWARAQLINERNLRRCEVCAKDDQSPFDRVLWPGYIGERYSEGRVLIVGAVHNAGQLRTREMEHLATYAERWSRDGDVTKPNEYLSLVRESYLTSARRDWIKPNQVWGLLDDLIKKLKVTWEQVAFTNWSKCKSLTSNVPGATNAERKKEQDRRYLAHIGAVRDIHHRLPIEELRPNALFICCGLKSVVDEVRAADLDIPIIRVFDQPRATNRFAPKSKFPSIAPYHQWLHDDVKMYEEMVS